jgi:hypothetical protein
VKLTHGLARRLLEMPAAARLAAVKQLLEAGELPRANRSEKSPGHGPQEVAESLVTRLRKKGDGHARAVVEHMARLVGMEDGGKRAGN